MHIGKHIWKILNKKHISVKEFATMNDSDRTNMYRILHRESINTSVLEHYSRVLNQNFFQDLADEYKRSNEKH